MSVRDNKEDKDKQEKIRQDGIVARQFMEIVDRLTNALQENHVQKNNLPVEKKDVIDLIRKYITPPDDHSRFKIYKGIKGKLYNSENLTNVALLDAIRGNPGTKQLFKEILKIKNNNRELIADKVFKIQTKFTYHAPSPTQCLESLAAVMKNAGNTARNTTSMFLQRQKTERKIEVEPSNATPIDEGPKSTTRVKKKL